MKQNETKGFLRAGGHVLRQPSEVGAGTALLCNRSIGVQAEGETGKPSLFSG